MRAGLMRLLGATCLAVAAWAAPAAAQTTGHAAVTGGATAPTAGSVGAVAPAPTTTATPVAPTVQYMGPIVRSAATPSVDASTAQVTCLPAGVTTGFSSSTADPIPCPWVTSASGAATATGGSAADSAAGGLPRMIVPGNQAKIVNGLAAAPANAPAAVQDMIWTANAIIGLPYIYGGGHASFIAPGYDCSATVSYAIHGADMLAAPLDSTQFETWGSAARGRWVTIFANGGHAYMVIAGLRLDTSAADDPSGLQGPRWRPLRLSNTGFDVRHPGGL